MSKTLRIDGVTSTIAIFNDGTNLDLLKNPQYYYSSLNFHSGLPYVKEVATITTTVSFTGVTHDTITWDDGSKGCGKVICTAMNSDYGFGKYRNAIWLKFAELNFADKPEMEVGYHALVIPMLKIRKKWYGKPLYAWLKHVAVHRTADLKAVMYGGKRDRIGQAWRFVLEPLCYYTGKLVNKREK
jgi:hypothetical protein